MIEEPDHARASDDEDAPPPPPPPPLPRREPHQQADPMPPPPTPTPWQTAHAPPTPNTTPPPTGQNSSQQFHGLTGPRWAVLLGAGLIIVGSVMPWLTATTAFGTVSVNGTDGDGVLTLLLAGGVLLTFVTVPNRRSQLRHGLSLAGGLLVGTIALIDMVEANERIADAADASQDAVQASIGPGLWLVLAGAAAVVVGAVMSSRE